MEDDKKDDPTEMPFLSPEEVQRFANFRVHNLNPIENARDLRELAHAEITRRQTNAQTQLLRDQGLQLEAQGKQLEAQALLTRSLKTATWVLVIATVLLALATLVPWIWPRH